MTLFSSLVHLILSLRVFHTLILYINSRSACVCDGARVRHRRTTGPGPEKTGLEKRDSEKKTGLGKTGFGLQADRARPSKNGLISVCALQLQLQSYKRVYVCPELTCLTCFCL
jgi:hypothetical protein